jgi:predicted esterase
MSVTASEEVVAYWRRSRSLGTQRDFSVEEPVSDAEFEVFRRMYAYDRYPLNAVVERTDTSEHWIRETVSFDTPYAERGGAFLLLPRNAPEPLQPILYWGGSGIYDTPEAPDPDAPWFGFLVRAGRAVVIPHFKGAYGRAQPPRGRYGHPYSSSAFRDATVEWLKDLSATVDYLEERQDLDAERVGYYGFSHGGMEAAIVMAIEPRVKASVTNVGGLISSDVYPEADPFNFLPRATSPLLMINGQYDIVFVYETEQLPMYDLVGTPE